MSSPIRLSPIAPPPIPAFARTGSVSSGAQSPGTSPGASPGFSLNLEAAGAPTQTNETSGGLTGLLADQVRGVQSMQSGADAMVHTMLTGGDVNEAEVLTAVQKADLAFRMLLQIRNKLMDAYREVQQIQI
ncbi:flagellar hook-basal body complex protein FliE [Neorhodopirellula lusitana]|uniref:Flagellar hook-basal body complex protein FliE n=1 Tax=Neorhodopirellula lusitana TaxID=445327 RepID=A0ABY1PPC0_9BACT|nr:flagellar hook-basal body complex protein FliE [Neorhodopirellula lusitana]SMP39924.1 flagellar hook-basal body complex protein FliE [Neorhodopirellula lusitana]